MIITVDLNHVTVPDFEAICTVADKVVRVANQAMVRVVRDTEIKQLALLIKGPHKVIEAGDRDLELFTFSRKN